jgi:hypothetical protein
MASRDLSKRQMFNLDKALQSDLASIFSLMDMAPLPSLQSWRDSWHAEGDGEEEGVKDGNEVFVLKGVAGILLRKARTRRGTGAADKFRPLL